jgi:hypothetical protein
MADGATACPSCGAATAGASRAQSGSLPPVQFNLGRLTQTDRIVGAGSLVLFISLFLPWFGVNYGGGSVTVDGLWHGYMYITLILSLAVIVYMAARAAWNVLPFRLPIDPVQALPIITGISLVLTVISFVFKPGSLVGGGVGWRFGAFVGLVGAVVAFAPKLVPALQARMGRNKK